MREIILTGELGKKYGRRHRFAVKSPAEAVRALRANFKDFEKTILDMDKAGTTFAVFNGRENIGADQLTVQKTGKIVFAPVIQGAKQGVLQVILGAVLIVVGVVLAYFPATAAFSAPLIKLGIAVAVGGVVQLLTPVPSVGGGPQESESNRPNNNFRGAVNTTAQGHPVPVGYGRLIVGSAVISAGIVLHSPV
jgi:predicted phage tail protein